MAAALDDPALLHDHDAVRVADRGETVGDDEGGTALHEGVQAFLYQLFGTGVDGAGGFVQNQHRGIVDGRPGDGQELSLALAQVGPVAGQHGVIALRQTTDEAIGVGQLRGLPDFLVGGVQLAEADVVRDGAGKQVGILQDQAHGPAQVVFLDFIDEYKELKEWYFKNGFEFKGTVKYEHLPFTVGYAECFLGE